MKRTSWSHPTSPNNGQKFSECGRKQAYVSQRIAERTAAEFGQRAYKCSHCKNWHLTSQQKGAPV